MSQPPEYPPPPGGHDPKSGGYNQPQGGWGSPQSGEGWGAPPPGEGWGAPPPPPPGGYGPPPGGYGAPQAFGPPPGGYPPPPGGYPPPSYGQPGGFGPPPPYGQQIPTYLWQSIVCTLLCCLPAGVAAIVFATKVQSRQQIGDIAGALDASGKAKTWCIVSFVLGLLVFVAAVALGATGALESDSNGGFST